MDYLGEKNYYVKWLYWLFFLVLFISLTSVAAKPEDIKEIQLATTEPAPELKWQPKPELLNEAFKTTLMTTDAIVNIKKGVKMCEDYINAHPDNLQGKVAAYVIMAQSYFNLGEYNASYNERLKNYAAGRDAAQQVINLLPGTWAGWAWYAINLGRISQLKGVIKSLFLLGPFKKHVFHAEKLAPNSAFVLDAIGIMYRQVPWIAGGNMSKSEAYLEKSIKVDPDYTLGMLDLAITLLEEGKKEQAKTALLDIINAKNPSWRAHWLLWEKPKAEALLNDMDNYKKLLDEWHMLM